MPTHVTPLRCPFFLQGTPPRCQVLEELAPEPLRLALRRHAPPAACQSGGFIRCPFYQRVIHRLEAAHSELRHSAAA